MLERVRTVDADAAADILQASLPFDDPDARARIDSPSVSPEDVPELALLEGAGASKSCSLTGGAIPIADNPYETELRVGREMITLGEIMSKKAKALEGAGNQAGFVQSIRGLERAPVFQLGQSIDEMAREMVKHWYAQRRVDQQQATP